MDPIIIIGVILIILLIVLIIFGSSNSSKSVPSNRLIYPNIKIINFSFQPGTLTVPSGSTVTWANQDSVTHTVTSDTNIFSSGPIAPGNQFSFKFDTAGTYRYHCSIHPSMTGEIKV